MPTIVPDAWAAQPGRQPGGQPGAAPAPQASAWQSQTAYRISVLTLRLADRACCCAAKPAVVAVMPWTPGRRHRTDLLMCMHHFRLSQGALAAAGARAYDRNGELLVPGADLFLAPC